MPRRSAPQRAGTVFHVKRIGYCSALNVTSVDDEWSAIEWKPFFVKKVNSACRVDYTLKMAALMAVSLLYPEAVTVDAPGQCVFCDRGDLDFCPFDLGMAEDQLSYHPSKDGLLLFRAVDGYLPAECIALI